MNPELTFKLTVEESNIIMTCLAKQPYEAVAGVIDKMRAQAAPQLEPAAPRLPLPKRPRR